jgi:hypothetical protein
LIRNNRIAEFGTAADLTTSFYWNIIEENYFFANGVAVIIGDSANTAISLNQFLQGTGEQIRVIGFGSKICDNDFIGNSSIFSSRASPLETGWPSIATM